MAWRAENCPYHNLGEPIDLRIADTAWRDKSPTGAVIVEHSPIPFRNYPSEWAPENASVRREINTGVSQCRGTGRFCPQDATPYNVMFDEHQPVFLDVLLFRS